MKFQLSDAIYAYYPKSLFSISNEDYSTLVWESDDTKPSLKELETKRDQMQADYDSKSYARAREAQYPSITDVVVALAEKEEGNDAMWQQITAQRAKVKSDNPKPK